MRRCWAQYLIEFGCWAQSLGRAPTPDEIRERFGVDRATSYRWRRYLLEVWGKPVGVKGTELRTAAAPQEIRRAG